VTSTLVKGADSGHGQHRQTRRAGPVGIVGSSAAAGCNGKSAVAGPPRRKRRCRPSAAETPLGSGNGNSAAAAALFAIGGLGGSGGAADSPRTSGKHRQSQRGDIQRRLGAKAGSGVLHAIINQMPPHRVYIEPFLGWAAIMQAKLPADRNIGIDLNADRINEARAALPSAELTIGDGIRFLQNFRWQGGELVYCDPPYLLETRTSRARYQFEISDHTRLLAALLALPCYVMLSGYHSSLYADTLREWRMVEYKAPTRAGWRTEVLWCNFPEPLELHDYRFLGDGYRERQNIKRKIQRWSKKLSGMPLLERHALMAALRTARLEQTAPHSPMVDGTK